MIDLRKSQDPVRVFKNALEPNINPPGTWILYHTGDFSTKSGRTPIGIAVREAFDKGIVHIFQKVISQEPRQYHYYAVTRY